MFHIRHILFRLTLSSVCLLVSACGAGLDFDEKKITTEQVDTTPPTVSNFQTTTAVSYTGFTLHWAPATDNVTPAEQLEYLVCQGTAATQVDTLAECTDANRASAWTSALQSHTATGKIPGTTYYYNVAVRDEAGNIALYPGTTQATNTDTVDPVPGGMAASTGVSYTGFTLHWNAAADDLTVPSNLQYQVCSGASLAAIDTIAECESATTEMAPTAGTTSLAITGKTLATTYYYNVIVEDENGNRALYEGISQATTSDTTPPVADVFNASQSVTYTGFTLHWAAATDDVTSAVSLQYLLCSGGSAAAIDTISECENATVVQTWTANMVDYAITGTTEGTTYYYNVVVRDEAGNKSIYPGKTQATETDATAPTGGGVEATTSVGAGGFTVNWTSATDDYSAQNQLRYLVCVGNSGFEVDTIIDCEAFAVMPWTANVNSFAVTGKTASTTYYYSVLVKDEADNITFWGVYDETTTADTTSPTPGTFQSPTDMTYTSFTLNWSASTDDYVSASNLSYLVCSGAAATDIDTVSECENATIEMGWTAQQLSSAIGGKTTGTTSYYNVIVRDLAGNRALYPGTSVYIPTDSTAPVPGTFSASSGVDYTGFTLNWTAASDDLTSAPALEYFVCSSSAPSLIDSVDECESATTELSWLANTTTLVLSGKSVATTYYYNVIVRDEAGNRALYPGITQSTSSDTTAPVPGGVAASTSVDFYGFTLNWNVATDDLTPSASLSYLVCEGASPAAIDTVNECVNSGLIPMPWTTNVVSLVQSGKTIGTTYYYNVAVRDEAGNTELYGSINQATASDTTAPTAGAFGVAQGITESSFDLNWTAASDDVSTVFELSYYVCSGTNTSDLDSILKCESATKVLDWSTNTLNLPVSGKFPGSSYAYNVIVRDAAGNKTLYAATSVNTAADTVAPTAGSFAATTNLAYDGFTLNWTAASDDYTSTSNLTYYVCSSTTSTNVDSLISCQSLTATTEMAWTANTLSLNISGRTPATTYYFNVIAQDQGGNLTLYPGLTQATQSDTTDPVPGSYGATTALGYTSFTLNWGAATDDLTIATALEYLVCSAATSAAIDTPGECASANLEMNWTANTTSLNITGKDQDTDYHLNVLVRDAAGNVAMYSPLLVTTVEDVSPPTDQLGGNPTISQSTTTYTSFTVDWTQAQDDLTPSNQINYLLCSAATSAAIDTVAECEAATQVMTWTAGTTTQPITGWTMGQSAYFNVIAQDGAGNSMLYTPTSLGTLSSDTTDPTAGTFSAVTDETSSGYTLNWSAGSDDLSAASTLEYRICSSGATPTDIDTVAECEAAPTEMNWSTNVVFHTATGKSPSTTTYYNLLVRDEAGNVGIATGTSATTLADTVDPVAGTFGASTGVTETGYTLHWTAGSDDITTALQLEYRVCQGGTGLADVDTPDKCEALAVTSWTANQTSWTNTSPDVAASTNYYHNVVVRDGAGNRAIYVGITQVTAADTTDPVVGTFAATTGKTETAFTLNWNQASDNYSAINTLEYFVCSGNAAADIDTVAECLAGTTELTWMIDTTTLSISGKTAGTDYYYNVLVRDAAGNLASYGGITVTTDGDRTAPAVGTFAATTSVTDSSFTLNWSAASDNLTSANALQYYVCSGASQADIDTIVECTGATMEMTWTANTTAKAISGKAASTTYYYNVLVKDPDENIAIYEGKSQTTRTPFVTVWKTDNAGTSAANQITLPLESAGTYNFSVDWGDTNSDTITAWNQAEATHTYGSAGTYTVTITGTINGFRFNSDGDRRKLLEIQKWGNLRLGNSGEYFSGASNLTITAVDAPDLTGMTSFAGLFQSCESLTAVPGIGAWDVSGITTMARAFSSSPFNSDISNWDVSNVTDMSGTFNMAWDFNQDITGWEVGNVTNMSWMFSGAASFVQEIGGWDVSRVTDMSFLFYNALAFDSDITQWETGAVTNMASMFGTVSNPMQFNQPIGGWDVSQVTNMDGMFAVGGGPFNQDLSQWEVGNVTTMQDMFSEAYSFDQDLSGWDVSKVTDFSGMFHSTQFNQDISGWDVSSATDMTGMFSYSPFDQNIGGWDVSQVTDMSSMFFDVILSQANYDALLIGWSARALQPNVAFHAGSNTTYSAGAAATARALIIGNFSWTITDGGQN